MQSDDHLRPAEAPPELAPTPPPRVESGTLPVPLALLLAADGSQTRRLIVDALIREAGHEWLTYGVLEPALGALRPAALWMEHSHPQWALHYAAQGYHEVDPRPDDAASTSLPVAWTLDSLDERLRASLPCSMARQFVSGLRDAGLRSGVCLVLPAHGEQRRHFVSLESSAPSGRAMGAAMLGRVLTLGLCLNEYFARQGAPPVTPLRPIEELSSVQREILGHVARGESDKRIAHLLCMSSYAVDYHMRRLRHRFAARNRVQLAQACSAALR